MLLDNGGSRIIRASVVDSKVPSALSLKRLLKYSTSSFSAKLAGSVGQKDVVPRLLCRRDCHRTSQNANNHNKRGLSLQAQRRAT
ncbi:hypothetical protein L2E82_27060 [Cichorium intybus]|uniref:Uncharacterized protein n=1 Tax=Cichorium intybus TaxID=13427 RepID=A0ACB9CS16_CICIN|nr:hypothetical protein L2E82_27060 [Cichorium intybus]